MLLIRISAPLSWDEAVFATRARDLADSNFNFDYFSGSYWSDLRAPGWPAFIAIVFKFFGSSDTALRMLTLLFALVFLWSMAKISDLYFSRNVANLTLLLIILCPGFMLTATLGFGDLPAAACAMYALYFFVYSLKEGGSIQIILVPILLGIATSMRFGAGLIVLPFFLVGGAIYIYQDVSRGRFKLSLQIVMCGLTSAATVLVLLTTTILTTKSSPLSAKLYRIEEVNKNRFAWLQDLTEILKPGRVNYGFGYSFWNQSYFNLLIMAMILSFAILILQRRIQFLVACVLLAIAPLPLYGLAVRQFVTTYFAPPFAIIVWMIVIALNHGYSNLSKLTPTSSFASSIRSTVLDRHSAAVRFICLFVVAGAFGLVAINSTSSEQAAHRSLSIWQDIEVVSRTAKDAIGPNCRIATVRVPQVAWYSGCYVTTPIADADSDSQFLTTTNAQRLGITEEGRLFGVLIVEPFGKQPDIDQLKQSYIPERSLIIGSEEKERRVALLVLQNPSD